MAGSAALLVAMIFSGCGRSGSAPGEAINSGTETDPDSPKPLVILTWDEYFSPDVIAGFEKEHGIPVEFVTFSNLDEMDGLLRSRPADFDLLVASGGVVADLIELQFLQPIQRDHIPLMGNLDSRFLGLSFDPGNTYSVPYMWGTTLIAYRSDKIDEPEQSWKSLWNESYKGRVLMVDDGFDVYAAALLADGHDINSQDAAHLEQATTSLLEQAESLDARYVDIFEIRDKLLSGECWISMTYSSDAAVLAEEQESISYFIPEEGAPLWVDSFVIPRESSNSRAAHLFLDYLSRAEVAAANSNELWCASANREARAFLSKEILEDETLYLDESIMARCHFDVQTSPERQRLVNQGLKQVFDRVRDLEAKPRLSLLIWEEYLAPDVVERFKAETGARLSVTEVANSEQLKQELSGHPAAFDVVVTDEQTLKELVELKLVAELDAARLGGAVGRMESFLASPADPDNERSVPYLWGLTVLAGRAEIFGEEEPSWNLLWREDLRIGVLDEPFDLVWLALLAMGHDPSTAGKELVDEATARIAKRFPDFTKQMSDPLTALDALEAGELDLVVTYNGDAVLRASGNPGIKVALPKEGAPLWLDSMSVSRDAPNPDLAHRFIEFMTRPEASAATANALRYATPNPEARAAMSPELTANPVLYPAGEAMETCRFVKFVPEVEKHVHLSILRLVSGERSGTSAGTAPGDPGALDTREVVELVVED